MKRYAASKKEIERLTAENARLKRQISEGEKIIGERSNRWRRGKSSAGK
jgi:hypothetical protein